MPSKTAETTEEERTAGGWPVIGQSVGAGTAQLILSAEKIDEGSVSRNGIGSPHGGGRSYIGTETILQCHQIHRYAPKRWTQ